MAEAGPAKPAKKIAKRRLLIFVLIAILLFLFVSGILSLTEVWNVVLLEPILNFLVLLSKGLLGNFGLAIIALTIVIRLIMMPMTLRQLHSTRAMQAIQPKMKELQKKHAKDKQQLNVEVMKLYKEHAVNPMGCVFPMLVQFPIWIALYQSVIQALAYTPENLLGLSKHLYPWSVIQEMMPLNHHFLWLDLSRGDFIAAILTAASMWVLQKMSTVESSDPQQQSTSRMMLWIMPLMFGFFALTLPSGLAVYWIASNIISVVIQFRVTGWGTLKAPSLSMFGGKKAAQPADPPAKIEGASGGAKKSGAESAASPVQKGASEEGVISQRKKGRHGKRRGKRKN